MDPPILLISQKKDVYSHPGPYEKVGVTQRRLKKKSIRLKETDCPGRQKGMIKSGCEKSVDGSCLQLGQGLDGKVDHSGFLPS